MNTKKRSLEEMHDTDVKTDGNDDSVGTAETASKRQRQNTFTVDETLAKVGLRALQFEEWCIDGDMPVDIVQRVKNLLKKRAVRSILKNDDWMKWDSNIDDLFEEATLVGALNGFPPLVLFGFCLLTNGDSAVNPGDEKILQFLYIVNKCYHPTTPYHNARHALDVARNVHCFSRKGIAITNLTISERKAIVLAAIVHDAGHNGLNNEVTARWVERLKGILPFETDGKNALLERFSAYIAKTLMNKYDIVQWIGGDEKVTLDIVERSILGTDYSALASHVTFITDLKQKKVGVLDSDQKLRYLSAMLCVADVANIAKPKDYALKTAVAISREFKGTGAVCTIFFNDPVVPDNSMYSMSKTDKSLQMAFIAAVSPLLTMWERLHRLNKSSELKSFLTNMNATTEYWYNY